MMKFVSVALAAIALLMFGFSASAETSMTGTCAVHSQYHGSDGNVFDPDPSLQCSATVAGESGWYVGTWVAQDFDNKSDFGDEIDFYGGYAWSKGYFAYDLGAQYFVLTNIGDVWNFYGKASYDNVATIGPVSVSPYLKVDHYVSTDGSLDDGTLIRVSPSLSIATGSEKWSVTVDPQIFYDDGAFGNYEGFVAMPSVSVMYTTDSGITAGPVVKYSTPFSISDSRGNEFSAAFQVSKTW